VGQLTVVRKEGWRALAHLHRCTGPLSGFYDRRSDHVPTTLSATLRPPNLTGVTLNLARLRPTSSLLLATSISVPLLATSGAMWMSAQVATPPTPVIPPFQIDGAAPALGPFKMQALTGEPYSLTSKAIISKKFTDGTWHTTFQEERRMRDSEGRERSELLDASGRPIIIRLTDPVAQSMVLLQPFSKSATVTHVPLPSPEQEARAEEFRAKAAEYRALHPLSPDTESLPPQTIAGVYAEGKRRTTVLRAAKMPDGQQVRVVEETWTAPDLKIPLARTSDDPRGEKITMTVTDLQRADPDPALFQIPPDYKLVEQK
jgi:hypothetical protein